MTTASLEPGTDKRPQLSKRQRIILTAMTEGFEYGYYAHPRSFWSLEGRGLVVKSQDDRECYLITPLGRSAVGANGSK